MAKALYDFQEKSIIEISREFAAGKNPVLYQLATGGGKTVCFAAIAERLIKKSGKRVLICVHRIELLRQTIETLYEWYGIKAQAITKETKEIYDCQVYVAMVETLYNRLIKDYRYLPPLGLAIVDEAHVGNFLKLLKFFQEILTLGVTATPKSARKKDPLRNYYEEIVCGIDIPELIELDKLCQNHTYSIEGIKRKKEWVKNGEFDPDLMAMEFKKDRHVQNTIANYKKFADGKKAIVFNCNVEHSLVMLEAWKEAGYDTRHVDGTTDKEVRKEIFKWYKRTPGAILNNVGIATMGFDEATIECVIPNLSTMSLTKWLQMVGRGARIIDDNFIFEHQKEYPYPLKHKPFFINLDMGGNAKVHGDWNEPRDWKYEFHNPEKANDKLDAAPMKDCPQCEALIPARAMECPYCGYIFEAKEIEYDPREVTLELITKGVELDVAKIMLDHASRNEYFSLFLIIDSIANKIKYRLGKAKMDENLAKQVLKVCEEKAEDWCNRSGKKWNKYHKALVKAKLFDKFKTNHSWDPKPIEPIKMQTTI